MEQEKSKSEKDKEIYSLLKDVINLSNQINTIEKKLAEDYPLANTFGKICEELEAEKNKTKQLDQYKKTIDDLSKQIEELKQKNKKEMFIKWTFIISMIVGLLFLVFSAICVWNLLFPIEEVKDLNSSIPMLTSGIIVLVVMAIILVYLEKKCKILFN
jgi:hypothetical protein